MKSKPKLDHDRYHHGNLKEALVAAARALVEAEGPEGVSLRAVAQASGVSPAAPYHHFADKQALLAAVAAEGFRDFTKAMTDRAAGSSEPKERLQRLGIGYVAFGVSHPALFRLMHGPAFQNASPYPELDAARQKSYLPLAEAIAANLPGASRVRIFNACAAAWSIVHGMAILASEGRLAALIDLSDIEKAARIVTAQLDVARALGS